MTNEVEIFFEDVPQQQNVLNVSTSVNESGESELIVGLSAYQIAVNRGFVGTVEEWLDSLKATADVVDTTPQRKTLVPDGALETSDGQYQVFTSDNTNQLLPLLGAGGLTAEMTQVDWLDPKTNEFTVRVKIPAGLDTVDLDAPISPLVYVMFTSTNLLDIFSGNGIGAIVVMEYNKNAGVLQLIVDMTDGDSSASTTIPYVIDQEIEIKYNKIYNSVTLKTLDNGNTVLTCDITTPEHDLMNVGVMYANFSQPTPIVSLSAYVETTPIVVNVEDSLDKINTRINAVESSIESLEQTNTSLGSRVDYLNDTQFSMQQQLSTQSDSISNVNHTVNQLSGTVNQLSGTVNQLSQNSVTPQSLNEQVTQSVTQSLIPVNQKIDSSVTLNAVIVTDPTIPITQQYDSSIEYYLLEVVYNQPDITGTYQIGEVLKRTIGTNTLIPMHFSFRIDRLFSVPVTASNRRVTVSYYERLRKWLPIDSDVVLGTNTYYTGFFGNNSKVQYNNNNQDQETLGLNIGNSIFKCVSVDYQKFESYSFTLLIGQNSSYEIIINALSTGQVGLAIQSASTSSTTYYRPLITEPRVISDVPYTIIDSLLVLDVTEGDVVHIDCRKLENLTGVATDKVRTLFDVKLLKSAYTQTTTDTVPEGANQYFTEQRVRDTQLLGLSTATATPITATDSVLSAAGKLQAQISAASGSSGGFYVSGIEYSQDVNSAAVGGVATAIATQNTMTLYPFRVVEDVTIDQYSFVTGNSTSNDSSKFALYEAVPAGRIYSLTRLTEQTLVNTSAENTKYNVTASATLRARKLYFFGIISNTQRNYLAIPLTNAPSLGYATSSPTAAKTTALRSANFSISSNHPNTLNTTGFTAVTTVPIEFRFRVASA